MATATILFLCGLIVTAAAAKRSLTPTRTAFRWLTATWTLVVLATTSTPRAWPPKWEGVGDLVLRPGGDTLRGWSVIFSEPNSLAAVLLIANVGLFVPIGFFALIGWRKMSSVLLGAALLSVVIELAQLLLLSRVAATDDVLCNVTGAALGAVVAAFLLQRSARLAEPAVPG